MWSCITVQVKDAIHQYTNICFGVFCISVAVLDKFQLQFRAKFMPTSKIMRADNVKFYYSI